jgi:hypothetical protein
MLQIIVPDLSSDIIPRTDTASSATWEGWVHLVCSMETQVGTFFIYFLRRPNLFAICNNTFSKWWESVKDGWLVEEYSVALLCK